MQIKHPIDMVSVALYFDNDHHYKVGRLAIKNGNIFFEYDVNFIARNYEISPFMLPLKQGLIESDSRLFEGLFGVFNDSLPDGWGRLLLDRKLKSLNINPHQFSPLDRLCNIGHNAIGALVYEPDYSEAESDKGQIDLVEIDKQVALIQEQDMFFEHILKLNGSSAGARPKALIGLNTKNNNQIIHGVGDMPEDFEHWLVKFHNNHDDQDSGLIEYAYSKMGKHAGINMPQTQLLNDKYFAIQRFDRNKNQRLHVISACGLLHSNFRTPSLDYKDLIRACYHLTKDIKEVEKIYRLAVFNVLAHNRDDHSKNFSFVMDKTGNWQFAPAYDLTFSYGPSGEQSTMVMGEGKNFTKQHFLELANLANISEHQANEIILQTQDAINQWHDIALDIGISKKSIREITKFHLHL